MTMMVCVCVLLCVWLHQLLLKQARNPPSPSCIRACRRSISPGSPRVPREPQGGGGDRHKHRKQRTPTQGGDGPTGPGERRRREREGHWTGREREPQAPRKGNKGRRKLRRNLGTPWPSGREPKHALWRAPLPESRKRQW